jgi:hypothetical protein
MERLPSDEDARRMDDLMIQIAIDRRGEEEFRSMERMYKFPPLTPSQIIRDAYFVLDSRLKNFFEEEYIPQKGLEENIVHLKNLHALLNQIESKLQYPLTPYPVDTEVRIRGMEQRQGASSPVLPDLSFNMENRPPANFTPAPYHSAYSLPFPLKGGNRNKKRKTRRKKKSTRKSRK